MSHPDTEFRSPPAQPSPAGASIEDLERRLAERTFELERAHATVAAQAVLQRESQSYFEKSFHASPALMGISRLSDRRITEANPAFLRACGFTREEVIGRTTDELDLWATPQHRDEFLAQLKAHGAVRNFEGSVRSKSGRIGYFLVQADILEIGGEPSLLTVGIDITDRRRRDQVQAATYAISQAVLAGGELPALFARLHQIVGELIPAKNFYVAVLSPDGALLSFPYFVDETASTPAPRKPGSGLTEYVLHTAKPLRTTADELTVILRGDSRYRPTGKPSAQWLGAPLIIEGRAIGVITVQDYHKPNAYTEADLKLLMFVADQTAAAVHRAQVEAAQRESRAYFEKSFHSNPALMAITNAADQKLIEVNPAFSRSSGYSREEVLGRSTLDLNLWVQVSQRDEYLGQMHSARKVRDFEADFRDKSGGVRTLILNADLIELDGRPCVLTVGIDVTERHRREQVQNAIFQISRAVLTSDKLEVLLAEVHSLIGRLMPAQNFYVALRDEENAELWFPYFVDEHAAPPAPRQPANGFTDYIIATARPVLAQAAELEQMLSARGVYLPLEHQAAQRLGAPLVVGHRVLGAIALQDYDRADAYDEEDLRLLNFVAEQTALAVQRRQAGDALTQAEQKYRGIFENALEGIYITSPEGRFVSANPALARILGYDTPAALLTAVADIRRQLYVQQNRRDEFLTLIQRNDALSNFESEVYRRDGSTCWISESVRVVRNTAGGIDRFEGVVNDVTQQREAARVLREAKEAADAASRAKSLFLASVSHELRTPLNGILGYTQILRRDSLLNDRQLAGVGVIHESADHLLALINDVLDLSKIEAGRIELHPVNFDLPEFVRGVERVFTPRAGEKNLRFETAIGADLPRWVRGDEQRIRQVVFNLVSNAVKFTSAGSVAFSIDHTPGPAPDRPILRFSVSDTGRGIAPEDAAKLFEPFIQVGDRACAAACGTGLGLAISRSLVERMGGRLQVESTPGSGSRFWFEVPLAAASAAVSRVADRRSLTGYEGPRRRVLVVDDNATNRGVLVDMLMPLGFELAEAADGTTAVRTAKDFRPDLVLMDLRLPGEIDGPEATRILRRSPRGGDMRIVAVSASAYDRDRSECFEAGCDDFLAKPFREEQLWALLERLLGLTWLQAELSAEAPALSAGTLQPPPPAEVAVIHELAAQGDVVGLRARAQALIALDPKYSPFAQHVLELAARFKMKAIRQFVARFLR